MALSIPKPWSYVVSEAIADVRSLEVFRLRPAGDGLSWVERVFL